MRPFDKPALSIDEQLQILKNRGLTILDDQRARRLLEVVSFFRLSPYMRPFQSAGNPDHHFCQGATLRQIVTVYRFDSELRNLVMEAIEHVEVAVRACITNHMAPAYGAHWYLERGNFKDGYHHARLVRELREMMETEERHFRREAARIYRSRAPDAVKSQRIEHRKRDNYFRFYGQTYNPPELPPSWAVLEELSLGALSWLYQGIARDRDRKRIARRFGLPHEVLGSWLHTLTFVRNCCAHHSRLWNRELSIPPALPNGQKWRLGSLGPGQPDPKRRLFVVLLMLGYLMEGVGPDQDWKGRLEGLLTRYAGLPLAAMGMADDWKTHPIWAGQ